jgi:hypothetical protein
MHRDACFSPVQCKPRHTAPGRVLVQQKRAPGAREACARSAPECDLARMKEACPGRPESRATWPLFGPENEIAKIDVAQLFNPMWQLIWISKVPSIFSAAAQHMAYMLLKMLRFIFDRIGSLNLFHYKNNSLAAICGQGYRRGDFL